MSDNLRPKDYVIFVGNPGTGKSTWLNMFCREAKFKSGYSLNGNGITTKLQLATVGNTVYGDTPGLDDMKSREEAAREISQALRQDGRYKLIFFVTLTNGRVRSMDATMIKVILNAIEVPVPFAIVINMVSKKKVRAYEQNPENLNCVVASLLSLAPRSTVYFHILSKQEELTDEDNVVPPIDPNFVDFIERIPFHEVKPDQVKDIEWRDYEKVMDEQAKMINELQGNTEKVQKALDAMQKRLEQEAAEHEKDVERMQEDANRRFEDLNGIHDKQLEFLEKARQEGNQERERHYNEMTQILNRQIDLYILPGRQTSEDRSKIHN